MFANRVLRRILGPKREEVRVIGVRRKSHGEYLHNFILAKYYQIKENEGVWACGTHGREGNWIQNFDSISFSKVYVDLCTDILLDQFVC
jgi:hypothetical protein